MNYFFEGLIRRNVSLREQDWEYVKKVAKEKGLGGKGLSAAIRLILAERQEKEKQDKHLNEKRDE